MTNLNELAAFNPTKLALMLASLPNEAIVFGLQATGPLIAVPDTEYAVIGAYVYSSDTVSVVTGPNHRIPLGTLSEIDGVPVLNLELAALLNPLPTEAEITKLTADLRAGVMLRTNDGGLLTMQRAADVIDRLFNPWRPTPSSGKHETNVGG